MQMRWLAVPVLMAAFGGVALAADCPPLLEGIGRHADHFQPLILVALIQGFEAFELRGESAKARGVDNNQRLAGKALAQVDGFLGAQLGQLAF